ncbi:sensor histidine kinase [Chryseosolibacter indicus]|uniref:Histidine kinase n=1 Tax=Chryseosolibacter indicus TaxID=2782351 RepID=A0ABS5VU62_9BACT|nr:histidine kinase [Chryseosolibacter indicus]MBT1704964.1 histidine kinase [Chryseosolibacter indicus]
MQVIFRKWTFIITVGAILMVLFYGYLYFSESGKFLSVSENLNGILLSILTGAIVSSSIYLANTLLDRWIAWKNNFAARFITGYFVNVIISLAICLASAVLFTNIFPVNVFGRGLSVNDDDVIWKIGILMLASVFIYKIIYALLYSYQHYAVAQIENLQNERRQLELQFEALKAQVSPHYLFNSLNTISSLLFKDLPSAEQFIRRLAQTYQYILSTQDKKYVLLKDELEFVKSYYYLLRIRFQQQLDLDINVPSGIMNTKIPPLTLQMLVENAVKHNNLSGDKKLFIYITAQDNTFLKVINTKTESSKSINSFHVGLENIKRRYQFFTNTAIQIKDDEKFMVSLPVIHSATEFAEHKFSA